MALKTNYTNDILDTTKNTERKYNIKSASGTIVNEGVTFEDVTEYTSEGDRFGASDINATNEKVNLLESEMVSGFTDDTYSAVTGLAYDSTNKKLGLKVGADTIIPFSSERPIGVLQNYKRSGSASRISFCMNDGSYLGDLVTITTGNNVMSQIGIKALKKIKYTENRGGISDGGWVQETFYRSGVLEIGQTITFGVNSDNTSTIVTIQEA